MAKNRRKRDLVSETGYRESILELARKRSRQRIPNGQPAHASALFEAMLLTAQNNVCIFSNRLVPEVFDQAEVLAAAIRFVIDGNRSLKILVQDDSDIANRGLAGLTNLAPDRVTIRKAVGSYATSDAKHFCVMDERAFRFEFDHDQCSAIANFNEPEVAKRLQSAFDGAFDMGVPVAGLSV
jgi:hypothetical protein